jgi:hypothetical protein
MRGYVVVMVYGLCACYDLVRLVVMVEPIWWCLWSSPCGDNILVSPTAVIVYMENIGFVYPACL